jgi:hypothetical protein
MEKTILTQLLSNKPQETKSQLTNAFAPVRGNFEFAVSVDMSKTKQHMDEANRKGFGPVWCNSDSKTAILYSFGLVDPAGFADMMTWLETIRVLGDVALVHFAGADGDKIVEIA